MNAVQGTRLLLIEDNPGDARIVRALLLDSADHPFVITWVTTLAEAIAAAQVAFDIVLTDLSLPDSRGLDTVRAVLAAFPSLPVVVLTGLADAEIGIQAVQSGCQDYLAKGGDGEALRRTLEYAIERKAAIRALRESEERFRSLVEVSPDAIFLCTEDGIVFANPAALRMAGDGRGGLGRPFTEFLSAETRCDLGGKIAVAVAGLLAEPLSMECRLAASGASAFDAEVTLVPIRHQDRPAVQLIIRDVTQRKLAERRQRLAATVFQTTAEAMMVTDVDNLIVSVNSAFSQVTGYDAAEVLGTDPKLLSSGRHSPEFYERMWRDLHRDGHWHGEVWNRRKNGEVYVQRLTLSEIRDETGAVTNYVSVFSDITDEKREAEQIRYRASYDALTGLPNRSLLQDRLSHSLAKVARDGSGLAVFFIDLDGFKPVNDSYGHLTGDQLLQGVAERLTGCVRESDTVARLGGDEFVVVVHDLKVMPNDAVQVAEKILSSLSDPFVLGDVRAVIGASIGISLFPDHGASVAELVDCADKAMYVAKQRGKGRFHLFGDNVGLMSKAEQ